MANNCEFSIKVVGKRENVEEFMGMITPKSYRGGTQLGRVFYLEVEPFTPAHRAGKEGYGSIIAYGDCAWSLKSAFRIESDDLFLKEIKRLDLVVEAFSTEPGNTFQEHLLVNRGEIEIFECVDYYELDVEAMNKDPEYKQQSMDQHDLTEEHINENAVDGYLKIGGLDDYEDFVTETRYFGEG